MIWGCGRSHAVFGVRLRSREDYSTLSPVIAAAETFHEGGPSHPAFSESSVSTGGKAPSVFRAWVDCAEGGKWPKDFSPERCLLWCAPTSEIDMVQHLLISSGFRGRLLAGSVGSPSSVEKDLGRLA